MLYIPSSQLNDPFFSYSFENSLRRMPLFGWAEQCGEWRGEEGEKKGT